ncbi:hypothetical protein, partial [Escherichia coli]|uniref:hypothetical protein n=1 Tax=Escherichia coli TaxID=562 RepID=UPI0017EA1E14
MKHLLAALVIAPLALLGTGCGDRSTAPPAVSVSSTPTTVAQPPPMTSSGATLTWYGHAAFKLVTPGGKVIFFD